MSYLRQNTIAGKKVFTSITTQDCTVIEREATIIMETTCSIMVQYADDTLDELPKGKGRYYAKD